LIVNEVNKIREIEKLKEQEMKEAQRQAQQILFDMEKKIDQLHTQALQNTEKKAEKVGENLLNDARKEVEAILHKYEQEAIALEKEISQRIPLVVEHLLGKVWEEYGN